MATFKERSDMRRFVRQLETVSCELAAWAQAKGEDGWTVADCKLHLKNAAEVAGRFA